MVQNATDGADQARRRPGRRPGFDHDAVVAAAIRPFWEKGFADTTLADLEEATGVDRSTLYNSFGGKKGLHKSACAAYVQGAEDHLFGPLLTGSRGIADISLFTDRLGAELLSEAHPRGCLIVNDITGRGDEAATQRYLRSLDRGLALALERAVATGEMDPGKVEQRRHLLVAAILGLNLANKHADDPEATIQIVASIRKEIGSWILPAGNQDDPVSKVD